MGKGLKLNKKYDLYFQVNTNSKTVLKLLSALAKKGEITLQDVHDTIDYILSKKCSFKNEYLMPHSTIASAMDIVNNIFEAFLLDQLIKFNMVYTDGEGDWDQYRDVVSLDISDLDFSRLYPMGKPDGALFDRSDFDDVIENAPMRTRIRTIDTSNVSNTLNRDEYVEGPSFSTRTIRMRPEFSFNSSLMYPNRNGRVYNNTIANRLFGYDYNYSLNFGNSKTSRLERVFVVMSVEEIAKIFYNCILDEVNPYEKYDYTIFSNRLTFMGFRLDSIGLYRLTNPYELDDTIINRILFSYDDTDMLRGVHKLDDYCDEKLFTNKTLYIEPDMDPETLRKIKNEDLRFNYGDKSRIILRSYYSFQTDDNTKGYELLGGNGFSIVMFDNVSSKCDEASENDRAKLTLLDIIDKGKERSTKDSPIYDTGVNTEQLFFTFVYNGYLDACKNEDDIQYIKDNYKNIVYAMGHAEVFGGYHRLIPYDVEYKKVKSIIERLKEETGDDNYFEEYVKFYGRGEYGHRTADCGLLYDEDGECLPTQSVDSNLHNRTYYDSINTMKRFKEKAEEEGEEFTGRSELPNIQHTSYTYLKYTKEYEECVDESEKLLKKLFLDKFGRYPKVSRKLAKALVGGLCGVDFRRRDELLRDDDGADKLIERLAKHRDRLRNSNTKSKEPFPLDMLIRLAVKEFNKKSIKSIKSVLFGNEYLMLLAIDHDFSGFDLYRRMMLNFYIDTGEKYFALVKAPIMKFIAKHGSKLSIENLKMLLKNISLVKDCNSVKEAKRVIANRRANEEKEKYEKKFDVEFPECNSITLKDAPVTLNGLTMRMLDVDDPRNFIVGLETNCCYHCDGAAQDSLFYSVTMPNSANVVIENANKDILATSWVWLTEALMTKKYDEAVDAIPEPRTVQMLVFDNIEFANDADISKYIDIIKAYVDSLPYDFINMGLGYNNINLSYFYDLEDICDDEKMAIDFIELGRLPEKWEDVEYGDDISDVYTDYEAGYKDGYVILKRDGKTYINLNPDFEEEKNHHDFGNTYSRNIIENTVRYNERDTMLQDMIQHRSPALDAFRLVNNDDDLAIRPE